MKKHTAFRKKAFYLLLAFTSLFFFDSYYLSLAFAESGAVINDSGGVQNKKENNSASIISCGGVGKIHTTRKVVALTFDDGPSKYTDEILEILKLNNIKATFFFVGNNAGAHRSTVLKAYQDGNIIGNHTYSHANLSHLNGEDIETELTKNSKIVHRLIGVYPAFFRPPYGACSDKSRRVARNLGLKTIRWSAMVDDYHADRTTSLKIASGIIELVGPGAIIGLHDGGGNREKTVEALPIIICELKRRGYEILPLSELLGVSAYIAPDDDEGVAS